MYATLMRRTTLAILTLVFIALPYAAAADETGAPGSNVVTTEKACVTNGGVWLSVPIGATKCVGSGTVTPLEEYIQVFYVYFVGAIGTFAAVMVMWGGYKWVAAAGNRSKIESAKSTIISAAFGLMLTLTSYLLLNIINPKVLNVSVVVKNIPRSNISTGLAVSFPKAGCTSISSLAACTNWEPNCHWVSGDPGTCQPIAMCGVPSGLRDDTDVCCWRDDSWPNPNEYAWTKIPNAQTCKTVCDELHPKGEGNWKEEGNKSKCD